MLIIYGLVLFCNTIFSQAKFEADAGLGLFEAASLKVKYGKNIQFAVCQGFFDQSLWMTGFEFYFHYAGESKYTDQLPVYFMAGLSGTIFAYGYDTFEKIAFYPRIGKSFNFSKNIGVNLDVGLALVFTDDGLGKYVAIPFPTGGAHLFLRI